MSEIIPEECIQLIELQPGENIDLQINHPLPVRLRLALVGYEIGKYIILQYPNVKRSSEYSDVLVEGNVVIARYLMEGNKGECFAFRSAIRHTTQYPEKLIFIEYPKKIENRQLRQQQRNSTHLPAIIILEDLTNKITQINGFISDISAKGCGFTFTTSSADINTNKRDIFVCLQSPTDGEVKIPARICNSRNVKDVSNVGIQFLDEGKIVPALLAQLSIDRPFG
ncbi:MAG: PilZ domain-containing protein [Colwellia sp.]